MVRAACLWAPALLPVWPVLVLLPFRRTGVPELTWSQLGYLRRGAQAAIRAAVVELHARGLVDVAGRGVVARSRAPMRSGGDPLARAVYAAMPTPTSVRMLRGRSRVRKALAQQVAQLAGEGLLPGRLRWLAANAGLIAVAGASVVSLLDPDLAAASLPWSVAGLAVATGLWFFPRRTVAGHREPARRRRALAARPPDDPDLAVASYALRRTVPPALVPAFARERARRQAGDHPSAYDHRGVWAQGGWEPP